MEPEDEKAALRERGIGLTKTHVYIAPAEERNDPDVLIVSMSDYFEGETFQLTATELELDQENGEWDEGEDIDGVEGEESAGRISGSQLKTCMKDTTFQLPPNRSVRIEITYLERSMMLDITPGSRSGWIDWTNL